MKRTTKPRNTRLTSSKDRRKQTIIKSVVKRRERTSLRGAVRRLWRIAKVLILAAFAAGLYWGATEGYRRLFWENPDYALKEVTFQTNGSMTAEQAVATTGFQKGRNIFSYKLDQAREKLLALPQVAAVEIRRYLPGRIEIAVTERKPVAWIAARVPEDYGSAERSHLVDARGFVFQPRKILAEYRSLPVICGLDEDEVKPGHAIRSAELDTSLELLSRIGDRADFRVRIVDLSKGWCVIVTDQRDARITFGLDKLDEQLERLDLVRKEAARYGQDLRTVNVMIARNVPATFVPPSAPEPDLDAELLGEIPKAKPVKPASSDPTKTPAGGTRSTAPPARKSEPTRSRETPGQNPDGLLRPFRRA